jgi:hypothetical protein
MFKTCGKNNYYFKNAIDFSYKFQIICKPLLFQYISPYENIIRAFRMKVHFYQKLSALQYSEVVSDELLD